MAEVSHQVAIVKSLFFLEKMGFKLTWVDPLELDLFVDNQAFSHNWQRRFKNWIDTFDVFLGFSFGGTIIQQCFSVIDAYDKPVILFSSPSRVNDTLYNKLNEVVMLCQEGALSDALDTLYRFVYLKSEQMTKLHVSNHKKGCERMISGLKRVMSTDLSLVVQAFSKKYIHFIGQHSNLITASDILMGPNGCLIQVPQAGMRILEDNPSYCQPMILDYLS